MGRLSQITTADAGLVATARGARPETAPIAAYRGVCPSRRPRGPGFTGPASEGGVHRARTAWRRFAHASGGALADIVPDAEPQTGGRGPPGLRVVRSPLRPDRR